MSRKGNTSNYEYIFKIILIGSSGVGKSSILQRYIQKSFNESYSCTIGVDFFMKSIEIGEDTVKLQLWDTAGTEKYRSLTTSYYRGAHAAYVVFDLTNRETFDVLPQWIENYYKFSNADLEKNIILIGNKSDLAEKRVINKEEIDNFIKINGIVYYETSAKNGSNIEECFYCIAKQLVEQYKGKLNEGSIRKDIINNESFKNSQEIPHESKGCCG